MGTALVCELITIIEYSKEIETRKKKLDSGPATPSSLQQIPLRQPLIITTQPNTPVSVAIMNSPCSSISSGSSTTTTTITEIAPSAEPVPNEGNLYCCDSIITLI